MLKQCQNCRYCIKSNNQGAKAMFCGRVSFMDKLRFRLMRKKVNLATRRVKGDLTCKKWGARV